MIVKENDVSQNLAFKGEMSDTALNNSKMVRKIEYRLKKMFIDYNTGVIIRMNLRDKISLK